MVPVEELFEQLKVPVELYVVLMRPYVSKIFAVAGGFREIY